MRGPRAVAALFLAAVTARADAHAFLDRAEPRVGATVKTAPTEVELWFSGEIEPAFSTVEVTSSTGERVDNGNVRIDPSNRGWLHVPLKPLQPGDYTVRWRVVSVDTHATEGDFIFHVSR
jgi:methionine-rich copper-binding protein CopC